MNDDPSEECDAIDLPPADTSLGWSGDVRLMMVAACLAASLGLWWFGRQSSEVADRFEVKLVVDPNTAPKGVLLALPKLGPSIVDRIVAQREIEPFESLDDLERRVTGLGPVTMQLVRPFLKIEPDEMPGESEENRSRDSRE